jgi:hypothetical protein
MPGYEVADGVAGGSEIRSTGEGHCGDAAGYEDGTGMLREREAHCENGMALLLADPSGP